MNSEAVWCALFHSALTVQARANQQKIHTLLTLYDEAQGRFAEATRTKYSGEALDWLFKKSVFQTTDFVQGSGISGPSARRILRVLRERGLVRELRKAGGRRSAMVAFGDLLNVVEGRAPF